MLFMRHSVTDGRHKSVFRALIHLAWMVALVFTSVVRAANPAAGWCLKPDMNHDRQINSADIPLFIDALLSGPADIAARCAADMNQDTKVDGLDISLFVQVLSSPDSDGDGIPDIYETNNGVLAGPTSTGSNPLVADTDGDGLSDGDEVFDTHGDLDLHVLGASPVRKDLFVEVDWFDESEGGSFHSHRPTAAVVALITGAFANSPVPNPYSGPNGIALHVDYGQGGVFTGGNLIPGGDTVILFDSEVNAYKAANFNANRFGYFHYCIFAHAYNDISNPSSGFAEINGDDFVVTLQNITYVPWIAQTMMHELGHNLGLRHGGFENRNFKPNYNSVMNYRYQFDGIDTNCDAFGDGVIDYSIGTRIPLTERNLDENAGVCGTTPIDWDFSGTYTTGLQWNITCYAGCGSACGTSSPCCDDTVCLNFAILDYNDWANLTLSGLTQGDLVAHEIVQCQDVPKKSPTPPQ